jgi:hypothetical protein
MKTVIRIEDGEIFDPYDLKENFSSTCINCEEDGILSLKVVKFNERIFDVTTNPFIGEISIISLKRNGLINEVNFGCSSNVYSSFDQLNAITVMMLYVDLRKRQFDSDPNIRIY